MKGGSNRGKVEVAYLFSSMTDVNGLRFESGDRITALLNAHDKPLTEIEGWIYKGIGYAASFFFSLSILIPLVSYIKGGNAVIFFTTLTGTQLLYYRGIIDLSFSLGFKEMIKTMRFLSFELDVIPRTVSRLLDEDHFSEFEYPDGFTQYQMIEDSILYNCERKILIFTVFASLSGLTGVLGKLLCKKPGMVGATKDMILYAGFIVIFSAMLIPFAVSSIVETSYIKETLP